MVSAFRICQHKFVKSAFSGEGARLYGGRWNNPGTRLVYLASSVSLAQLEMLVHLESDKILNERYCILPVQIPPRLIISLDEDHLPRNWRALSAPPSTRSIGDLFVKDAHHAVLRVPSVIVPQEWNYLLNPLHSSFSKIIVGDALKFVFDPRLA